MSHSQLISVIGRVPFKDIKIAGYVLSSTNATSTFAQKYNNLTSWTSTMCTVTASSTTINATEYGWNLDHQGYFTRTASTLGCLVGAGTPDNNMAHIDYAYIGLGVYATSSPACTYQGGYYATCGSRYLVGSQDIDNHNHTIQQQLWQQKGI